MSGVLAVIAVVGLAITAWFLLPFALRKLETRRLGDMCRARNAIVLTYDDGPAPGVSDVLLDVLQEENAPATFFVIGRNAQDNPTLISRPAC